MRISKWTSVTYGLMWKKREAIRSMPHFNSKNEKDQKNTTPEMESLLGLM